MPEQITIVDYHAGNLTSVRLAVERLGHGAVVTSAPDEVRTASRLIFPGVGAAGAAMATLKTLGLDAALVEYARAGRPLLGVCLGAQIILDYSAEDRTNCLGLVSGRVQLLQAPEGVKIPHMGWNEVVQVRTHAIWQGVEDRSQFYFVHSYAPVPEDAAALGLTDYHGRFVSVLGQDNIVACQFHPERSGRVGLRVLDNFLRWKP
jgi:glutamine amidotransferase